MPFQIITLSGMLGSGKSTIGKTLADRLNFQYYSTGNAQRSIALARGVTTLELNKLADQDPSIDREIDSVFKNLAHTNQNYVIDSRLAFFFIPSSIKIKLNVDYKTAANRILNDPKRSDDEQYTSLEEAENALRQRRSSEVERFKKTYQVDIDNDENFDYIIDTTNKTADEVCNLIIEKFKLIPDNKNSFLAEGN